MDNKRIKKLIEKINKLIDLAKKTLISTVVIREEIRRGEIKDENNGESQKYLFKKDAKILLLGGDGGLKEKDMQKVVAEMGLPKNCIEWVRFENLKNLNIDKIKNSPKFSDIIIGASPHSTRRKGGAASLVSYIEQNQDEFARLQVVRSDKNELESFTKSNFKEAILKSALYERTQEERER